MYENGSEPHFDFNFADYLSTAIGKDTPQITHEPNQNNMLALGYVPVARISIDLDTRVTTPSAAAPVNEQAWQDFLALYLEAAEGLLPGSTAGIHFAIADELHSDSESSGSGVFMVREQPQLSDVVAMLTGVSHEWRHHVVVLSEDWLKLHAGTDIRQTVAADLGIIVEHLYPAIKCEGPLADVLPLVMQMASFLLLTTGRVDVPNLPDKAIGRVYKMLKHLRYPGEWNMQLVSNDYPFLPYLVQGLAEACALRAPIDAVAPPTLDGVAELVSEVVASVVEDLGGNVSVQ
jgi:hypothetical protein